MQRKYVRVCGFYGNEFMNQYALLTDAEDDIAMTLLNEKFYGAILTIVKSTKGANHDYNKAKSQTRKAANIQ